MSQQRRQPDIAPAGHSTVNDCWNTIGVQGDGSCPELQRYVHCRNCRVYSAAAAELLNREPPPGYLDEWSDSFVKQQHGVEANQEAAVVFRVGEEWLALPTAVFIEVVSWRAIHSLPRRRGGIVLGLTNVRGELLVCVALEAILDLATGAAAAPETGHGAPRLLVLSRDGERVVFPVDEVFGTHRFSTHELQQVPATVAQAATYMKAVLPWNGKMAGLLDDELLFHAVNRNLA